MATERFEGYLKDTTAIDSTGLCGSGFDDPAFEQEGEAPAEEVYVAPLDEQVQTATYSIQGRALLNPAKQVALATWHMERIVRAEVRRAALLAPVESLLAAAEAEVARLRRLATELNRQGDQQTSWDRAMLEQWAEDPATRTVLGKTIKLAYGKVTTRELPGKTVWHEENLNPADFPELFRLEFNRGEARKRFELREDGRTLDTQTGEVLEVEVLVQAEPPSIRATVTPDLRALVEE